MKYIVTIKDVQSDEMIEASIFADSESEAREIAKGDYSANFGYEIVCVEIA